MGAAETQLAEGDGLAPSAAEWASWARMLATAARNCGIDRHEDVAELCALVEQHTPPAGASTAPCRRCGGRGAGWALGPSPADCSYVRCEVCNPA